MMKYIILISMIFLSNFLFIDNSISSDAVKYNINYNGLRACYIVKDSSISVDSKNIVVKFLSNSIGPRGIGGCGCTSALLKVKILNTINGEQIAQKIIDPQSDYKLVKFKNKGYKHIELRLSCNNT
ncbi:hypothetical protein N5853_06310 [Bartonella sp. HY329]|uniref:hypothetical protein n=1 Tax=unclassified Bartonella TaxID=2645622 RepID=UPI0021C9EACE|nr:MULTISPECIES: hypothetical protein [unclassified Bartonella]UXM96220.1 hypothetical protein N5853_06310 [Bartonella sp. HY329]UXN10544.1 hypothetical protein N5852_06320 [Bartonella sp. HY328]